MEGAGIWRWVSDCVMEVGEWRVERMSGEESAEAEARTSRMPQAGSTSPTTVPQPRSK